MFNALDFIKKSKRTPFLIAMLDYVGVSFLTAEVRIVYLLKIII